MKIVRLVHTADLHLGSLFTSTPEIAANRKLEQLDTLRNIVKLCHERNANVLLISGDLFDTMRVDAQLLAEVQSILGGSGVSVFIAPGNHDPATPDSSYMAPGWPENVHIFTGPPECVEIPSLGACIWGLGFRHSIEAESLLYNIIPKDNMINILVMHSEIVPDGSAESRYNPVTVDRLLSLGVDYCALGHAHKPTTTSTGEYPYLSSGCPSGRGFDETGDRGVFVGHVGKGFAHMEFVSTCERRYYCEKIDVSGCEVVEDYCTKINTALSKTYGADYIKNIYDITLIGPLAKGVMPDTPAIARQLMETIHYVKLTDMTTTELDIDALMKDGSLRGAFVRTMVGRMEKDEKNRNRYLRALLYGLRAFDGEVRINEDY